MADIVFGPPSINIYSLENYTFGVKDAQYEKDATVRDKFLRMEAMYEQEGMKNTADAVLLVHFNNHPHLLLLQSADSLFKLPGGKVKAGNDTVATLKRKLVRKLAPVQDRAPDFEIGEVVSIWYRPNFEPQMYPYVPAHVSKLKETKVIFIAHMPETCLFAIPRNYKLVAVPLHDILDSAQKFGQIIAALAHQLSRFHFNFMK